MRALSFVLLLLPAALAQDPNRIQVRTGQLAEGLHVVASGAGGNMALCVAEQGLLLVDTDYRALNEKLRAAIAGVSDKPVRVVVDTHWHFDHVEGNEAFARAGALIVAHENVRAKMAEARRIGIIDREVPASPPEALPAVTFRERLTLHWGGEEIELLHCPGAHTDGDTVVRFKRANVIHTGDIFFSAGYPFIEALGGGNVDGVIAAVKAILELCDEKTRIIPGHGPLARKQDLAVYGEMLAGVRAAVAKEMAAGKDLPAVIEARPTAPYDEKWGRRAFPPEKFVEIVWHSLAAKVEAPAVR